MKDPGSLSIRAVFSLAVLALAGVLIVMLSGHLWGRYQEQTAALGFNGVYERLVSQHGLAGSAGAADDPAPTAIVREAAAAEE